MSTVRIAAKGDNTGTPAYVELSCEVVHDVFALHPQLASCAPDPLSFSGLWTLTHIPTGFALCVADYAQDARLAADAFRALPVDWTFTDPGATASFPADVLKRCGEIRHEAAMGFDG